MNQLWEDRHHLFCDKACIPHCVTTLIQNDVSKLSQDVSSLLTDASMVIGPFPLGNVERNKVVA